MNDEKRESAKLHDRRGACPYAWENNFTRKMVIRCVEGAEENMTVTLGFDTEEIKQKWKCRYCDSERFDDCPYYWIASGKYEL